MRPDLDIGVLRPDLHIGVPRPVVVPRYVLEKPEEVEELLRCFEALPITLESSTVTGH